jgi:cyclopropane-fatty-acyl-phospholipid synthase
MATHYPNSKITAVSNSHSQRQYIQAQAKARGLDNLQVVTCDINDFTPSGTYDRVVSVEMFEHVRNHQRLLTLIGGWLKPEGKLFVHIFCHKNKPYLFQSYGASNWMGRYFFSGGMMPCFDLLPSVPSPLKLKDSWKWNGGHYSKTSRAWLERQDQAKSHVMEVIKGTYGPDQAVDWHNRWRMFFMACDELFSFDGGNQWYVAHYLFEKKSAG